MSKITILELFTVRIVIKVTGLSQGVQLFLEQSYAGVMLV